MRSIPTLVAVAAVVACSDAFSPTIENVAGDYRLQSLTTSQLGSTRDWVAEGATFTISLAANGTTTGHLFIPPPTPGDSAFEADLTGTWTLSNDTVSFSQTADSFVRDMPFLARENRLVGEDIFTGVTVRVALTK